MLSQGTYGAKVAVPLILELLAAKGVTATFFIPGRVAERHPDRVERIAAAGHEIAHHGYTHTSPSELGREEEDAELTKGLEVLRSFGADVIGYRSPAWDFSANTEELLVRHGFVYSSNFMDDLVPYRHARDPGSVELPIQWTLDDAAHFWFDADSWNKKIATAEEVRPDLGGGVPRLPRLGGAFILTMHPQIIGRPIGWNCSRGSSISCSATTTRGSRRVARSRPGCRDHVPAHPRRGDGPRARPAYGEEARDRVHRSVEAYREVFAAYTGWDWHAVTERARAYEALIEQFDPRYLEEMRGIADGAGLQGADVLAINVRTEVMFAAKARQAGSEARRSVNAPRSPSRRIAAPTAIP